MKFYLGNNDQYNKDYRLIIRPHPRDFFNKNSEVNNYLKKIDQELHVIVECRNQKEIDSALDFNFVNRILLDNYNPSELSKAISLINGKKSTEASGRIGINNIIEYAETGVDFISIGGLTNNLKSIDMSLKAMVI